MPTAARGKPGWLRIRGTLSPRQHVTLGVLSFVVPMVLWTLVSYVPFIWHPMVRVVDAGDAAWFSAGELVDGDAFAEENARIRSQRRHAVEPGVPARAA
jgi:NitT/TauT family transport system permease protein